MSNTHERSNFNTNQKSEEAENEKNSWPKKQKIFDRFEAAKLKTEITRKKAAGLKFIKKNYFYNILSAILV